MVELVDLIDKEELREQLAASFPLPSTIRDVFPTSNLPLVNFRLKEYIKSLFLFYNEDRPYTITFSNLNIITSNTDEYLNRYRKELVCLKEKKLWKLFNINVVYGKDDVNSYSTLENIDNEVLRILQASSTLEPSFVQFVKTLVKLNSTSIGKFFLNVNGKQALLFTSNAIRIFSYLLNYSFDQVRKLYKAEEESNEDFRFEVVIENRGGTKRLLNIGEAKNDLLENQVFTFDSEKWEKYKNAFEMFLEKLKAEILTSNN